MIRKFAAVSAVVLFAVLVTILAGAPAVQAQETPSQTTPAQEPPAQQPAEQPQTPPEAQQPGQQPSSPEASPQQPAEQPQAPQTQQPGQQPSSQEASEEETEGARKKKVRNYKNWTFNVGGGASLTNGTTKTYVRGGGGVATAGVTRNSSKYLGLRLDFQYDDLPLRNQALELAQAPSATSQAYSVTFDPIINIPVTHVWGGYIIFGPDYLHRSGTLNSSTAKVGSACDGFFTWWGTCYAGSLPLNGKFLSPSLNQFGYNFGGGITRKIRPNMDLYVEFRYMHAAHSGVTTDFRPITIGLRW